MPRSLALGNGTALVCLDNKARLRDLYFPYVGLENHIGGFMHRLGIWENGNFSWLDESSWEVFVDANDAFQGVSLIHSPKSPITITVTDTLTHTKNIFLRKFVLRNESDQHRSIRLFVNQQFEIYHSEKGDTAFFDPATNTVIHYEGKRAFLIGVQNGTKSFDDYSTGVFQMEGKEGTYRDAEDGELAKNPIEHGRVDSTIGIHVEIAPRSESTFHYWIAMGAFIEEVKELHQFVLSESPEKVILETADFWRSWANRLQLRFYGLGEYQIALFKRSQFYLRAHVDHRGAIIASGDSEMLQYGRDTYSYMWPRDAAYAAVALDWIGDRHGARTFFEFANDTITKDGYFMHKYRPDRSLGSSWHGWLVNGKPELPIQEDETALILWALWEHWEASKDLDFVSGIYDSLIARAADFILAYRDKETGLPKQSYNLWEEKFGMHTYTASSVVAALEAASRFAELLGDVKRKDACRDAAERMKAAIVKHCYLPEKGIFVRSLYQKEKGGGYVADETIDASSAYGVFIFGILPPDDERLVRAMKITQERLSLNTPVGGIGRYEGDNYYRRTPDVQGNPWIITTLWFAQYAAARAKDDHDLDQVRKALCWAQGAATRSGILPEQLDPHTKEHVSASPLTWSHAEYVRTVIMYLRRVAELKITS